jgi:hypothetical protein
MDGLQYTFQLKDNSRALGWSIGALGHWVWAFWFSLLGWFGFELFGFTTFTTTFIYPAETGCSRPHLGFGHGNCMEVNFGVSCESADVALSAVCLGRKEHERWCI